MNRNSDKRRRYDLKQHHGDVVFWRRHMQSLKKNARDSEENDVSEIERVGRITQQHRRPPCDRRAAALHEQGAGDDEGRKPPGVSQQPIRP